LKQFFLRTVAFWKLVLLPALAKLGFWGAGAVALLDSSSVPVPMDAFLAVSIWNHKGQFWIYCLMAAAGSAVGGLLPYILGRAGGELFLLKRIDRERFEAMRIRFERQEFLAVMIPSMLPPPAPWKMFIFASGVFEMRIPYFLLAVFTGRLIRWLILALLVIKLGPGAADLVAHHALAAVTIVGGVAVLGFGWWWIRKKRSGKLMQG
jgi:membrane protein YqaA with SNARE-associated domain